MIKSLDKATDYGIQLDKFVTNESLYDNYLTVPENILLPKSMD